MTNIIIDGNYIFHKTFGVFAGYGKNIDPGKILASKKDQSMFIRKIATDLCYSLRSLPEGGRLVFTIDSRSWRKDVAIEGGKYKDRERDSEVDWSIFFDLLNSFGSHIQRMGFTVSKVNGAEGDDLIWRWTHYFNSIGENCIIVSGDEDLYQLAGINPNGSWTIAWNSKSKNNSIGAGPDWKDIIFSQSEKKEISIFDMGDSISPESQKIRDLALKCTVVSVDKKEFLITKMLVGDKGDTVPGIWHEEKNGKTNRITPNKASEIVNKMKETPWWDMEFLDLIGNEEFLSWVSGYAIRILKGLDTEENRKKAAENLIRNFKLMWLSEWSLPSDVLEGIDENISYASSLVRKNVTLDRIKILEGTEWIDSTSSPSSYDPFQYIK